MEVRNPELIAPLKRNTAWFVLGEMMRHTGGIYTNDALISAIETVEPPSAKRATVESVYWLVDRMARSGIDNDTAITIIASGQHKYELAKKGELIAPRLSYRRVKAALDAILI